ncbi:hypothetical protein RN001_008723 [Aquatica leii]|uniref:Major facilitator superfamily (MFS) profile domain-containing protein n=1 Tax=Aquatica leii TaxID=1421715 RepID=A0AAN7SH14_9COLE|nr:hypothetical protein RN001_008723 [Aquatica leii]
MAAEDRKRKRIETNEKKKKEQEEKQKKNVLAAENKEKRNKNYFKESNSTSTTSTTTPEILQYEDQNNQNISDITPTSVNIGNDKENTMLNVREKDDNTHNKIRILSSIVIRKSNVDAEHADEIFPENVSVFSGLCYKCLSNIRRGNIGIKCISCQRQYYKKCSCSTTLDQNHQTVKWRITLSQTLAVLIKNVLVIVQASTLVYPAMLIPALWDNSSNELFQVNESQLSWIGSIALLCTPIGCTISGIITQPLGRKRAMQYSNIPFAICWIILYFSTELWHVYFALSVMGLLGGFVEAPLFAYVSEITEPRLRGILSATTSVSSALGILGEFLTGSLFSWRTAALISCSLPIICFCLISFVPESPYWLISMSRLDDAQKSLAWLRGWTTTKAVELEFKQMLQSYADQHAKLENKSSAKLKMLFQKSFLWPFSLATFTFFLSHFTGGTTLRVYAVKLFSVLETPIDRYNATVLLGLAEVLGAFTTVSLIRRIGKRIVAFISLFGVGVSNVVVAAYAFNFNVKSFNFDNDISEAVVEMTNYKWIPFVFLFLLAYTTQCGLRILPWILIGEIYLHDIRSIGCGLSGATSFVFGFAANKIYLNMISVCNIAGTYCIYAAISFIGIVVLYFTLPETEGKTLDEIIDHFSGVSKLDKGIGIKQKYRTNQSLDSENKTTIYKTYSECIL